MKDKKVLSRIRRKKGIRKKVFGTSEKPRLTVYRSAKNIFVQAIDDDNEKTLFSLSTLSPEVKKEVAYGGNIDAAKITGKKFNEILKEKNISQVVFDRNGYLFHGRVKTLADQIELKKKK
jgi:large subunit ribosomal protein L18